MGQYIYGKNIVSEKLNEDAKNVHEIYVQKNRHDDLIQIAKQKNIKVNLVSKQEIEKMVKGNHQGVLASIKEYEYYTLDDIISDKEYPLILVLDQIEDPHNFGAIIRTAAAVGVDGIVILNRRSVSVTATVAKTAAGALERVKIVQVTNLKRTIETLKDKGYWIVGSDLRNAQNYTEIDYKMKTVLVMGSEGSGMSRLVRESCDFIAKIPIAAGVESLNVSVATGICLYEVVRQRMK